MRSCHYRGDSFFHINNSKQPKTITLIYATLTKKPVLGEFFHLLFRNPFLEGNNLIKIIFFLDFVGTFVATGLATVDNNPFSALIIQINRLHQAAAISRPISGIDVNMLGSQAFGTMIKIARIDHFNAALFANKRLCFLDKSHTLTG